MTIERTITENIAWESPMDGHQATLHLVIREGETVEVGSNDDVYMLLANFYQLLADDHSISDGLVGFVIQTFGWAAPLDPDTGEETMPASEHPERRRVVLVATLTINGYCSAMKFARSVPGAVVEETTFEEVPASGKLWDVMNTCLARIKEVAH